MNRTEKEMKISENSDVFLGSLERVGLLVLML
jgi:hypothetical protein